MREDSRILGIREQIIVCLIAIAWSFVLFRYGIGDMGVSEHLLDTYDANIYYLIGNGWMNGKMPYVELADIKGPIVFLIWGVGSLISPCSFSGVAVLYAFILGTGVLYAYKTARLFLNVFPSVAALLLYMIYVAYGDGAPSTCILSMEHVTLYHLLLWGMKDKGHFRKIDMICMGCFVAAALLMKFNMAAFWIPICILALVVNGWSALWWLSCGFCAIFVPIIGYFYCSGALECLWTEYVETALAYGSCPWRDAVLFKYGFFWFFYNAPLCMVWSQYALPGMVLSVGGMVMLTGWLLMFLSKNAVRERKKLGIALFFSLLLVIIANFKGGKIFFHYSYPMYVYCLLSIIALLRLAVAWLGSRTVGICSICLAVVLHSVYFVLPAASKLLSPKEEVLVGRIVTENLLKRIATVSNKDFLVVDAGNLLHYYRLSGKLPLNCHFFAQLNPGGKELHRKEQLEYIKKQRPRYVLGTVGLIREQEELLRESGVFYKPIMHKDMGLPSMPASKSHKELVLYERIDR